MLILQIYKSSHVCVLLFTPLLLFPLIRTSLFVLFVNFALR